MISVAFVNDGYEPLLAANPFLQFDKLVTETTDNINTMISNYSAIYDQYMIEAEIMGELDEEKTLYLEAESSNIFDTIGKAVLSLFKKIGEIVKNTIQWFKDLGFRSKSNEDKAERLLEEYKKNDPKKYNELSQKIVENIRNGNIQLNDTKNIREAQAAVDDFMKILKQKDIDPKSLRGKYEELKRKLDNIDKSKTAKVATVGGAIMGLAGALTTFKGKRASAKKNVMDCNKTIAELNESFAEALQDLETLDDGKYSIEKKTKAQIIYDLSTLVLKLPRDLILKEQGDIEKMEKGIFGVLGIGKHAKKEKDEYVNGLRRIADQKSKKEQEARAKERTKNTEDSYDKSSGAHEQKLDAELRDDDKSRRVRARELQKHREDAQAKGNGNTEAKFDELLRTDQRATQARDVERTRKHQDAYQQKLGQMDAHADAMLGQNDDYRDAATEEERAKQQARPRQQNNP